MGLRSIPRRSFARADPRPLNLHAQAALLHSSCRLLFAITANSSQAVRISSRDHVASSYRQLRNAQLAGWLTAIVPNFTSSAGVHGSVPTPWQSCTLTPITTRSPSRCAMLAARS